MFHHIIILYYLFYYSTWAKDIERIYKHSQSQLSTLPLKTPVSPSSEPQTSSVTELTTTDVPSVIEKHQNKYVLYSQNTIQNYVTIINNDNIHSCGILQKQNYSIPTISAPNHC